VNRILLVLAGGIALTLAVGVAMAQETYEQSIKPYNDALGRLCPEKRLQNLSYGDFNEILEDYVMGLPSSEQGPWKQAAEAGCADSIAGVSCANISYIRLATKLRKIDEVAGAACQAGYACSTKATDCTGPGIPKSGP
jgi:hypothetical protein